ncbi:MAG: DUF116 domain-containing protein [Methanomicrobiales archaeon]|nr:DUF116 domain-containing protein [Methanomicrobiales archaeon]
MLFAAPPWDQIVILIGEITLLAIFGIVVFGVFLAFLVLYSMKRGKFYFPRLLSSGFVAVEGITKAIVGLFGLDDRDLMGFFVRVHNSINAKSFAAIPVNKRAVFLPQCLRSSKCPAHLTPEGLMCRQCGQCTVGEAIPNLRDMGYRVFIVPGSSFIMRMVKKYRPAAIIGVGCIIEVRDGLDMCDRAGLSGMGVVTLRDGCVETLVDWHDVFDVATLGVAPSSIPEDLYVSSK